MGNQNNSNNEQNNVPANEQNELLTNTHQPSLNNEPTDFQETAPPILSIQPPMEVHAHTHTPRKKWTHYFWEFFMLFLAVTLGFFVENKREHYIEGDRARQYASFLYSDLVNDSVNLNERIEFMMEGNEKLDTLISLLKTFKNDDFVKRKIYSLSAYAYTGPFFSATTSTMEQLKSSGNLRYFQSNELIGNFSKYDTDLQRLKSVEDRNAYLNEETRKFLVQFLDLKNISRLSVNISGDTSGFKFIQQSISELPVLYKTEKVQFQQYSNLCALKQLDWGTRINLQVRLQTSMRKLIASLKKEYRL